MNAIRGAAVVGVVVVLGATGLRAISPDEQAARYSSVSQVAAGRPIAQNQAQTVPPQRVGPTLSAAPRQYTPSQKVQQYVPDPTAQRYVPSPTLQQYVPNPAVQRYAPNPALQRYVPGPVTEYKAARTSK